MLAFLLDPKRYGGKTPHHIETHLSHIVLTDDMAYKLKKAITWSVVDYSSPEKRRACCVHEFEINHKNAPEIYLGVDAITYKGGALNLGGDGEAVDYVVRMRRFPDGAELDKMADAGALTPALMDATADAIAALHTRADMVRNADALPRLTTLAQQLERDCTRAASPQHQEVISSFGHLARQHIEVLSGYIAARGRHGFVRRCHGDLHLSNICVWQGRPQMFDAIEFSDDIGTIDVIYDLAFVLIDLEARGHSALSARLLSRYLERTRDYGGLALLPLAKSLRHMVRTLVGAEKGREIAPHIDAANTLLSRRAEPHVIAVGGRSGSGKSTVAAALSSRCGAVVLRSDVARKRLFGLEPDAPLDADAYHPTVTQTLYRRLLRDGRKALRAGSKVILDATFLEERWRDAADHLAADLEVPMVGVWLDAPAETLVGRVNARQGDASDADAHVVAQQLGREIGTIQWPTYDATQPADETAQAVIKMLNQSSASRQGTPSVHQRPSESRPA
ncbi:MAG: AAA family ATPase [Pseudomonadota bacterium]